MNRVHILGTGGTIEKTYNQQDGTMGFNAPSCIPDIIREGKLTGVSFESLFQIDSLEMTDEQREVVATKIASLHPLIEQIVITHGTDTMIETAQYLGRHEGKWGRTIVLTGAMVPYSIGKSDALGNVASAVMAARTIAPDTYGGVHLAMNGNILLADQALEDPNTLFFDKPPVLGPPNYERQYKRVTTFQGGTFFGTYEEYVQHSVEREIRERAREEMLSEQYPPILGL